MKAEKHSSEIIRSVQKLMEKTPLKQRFKISLEMHDYDNWDNGTYKGEVSEQLLNSLLKIVTKWQKDGAELEN